MAFTVYSIDFPRVFQEFCDNILKILREFYCGFFHTENILTSVFCMDLILSGPYFKTLILMFCLMDLTLG